MHKHVSSTVIFLFLKYILQYNLIICFVNWINKQEKRHSETDSYLAGDCP